MDFTAFGFDNSQQIMLCYNCLGTKFGFMPCERLIAVRRSYIPGKSLKAAKISGFYRVRGTWLNGDHPWFVQVEAQDQLATIAEADTVTLDCQGSIWRGCDDWTCLY